MMTARSGGYNFVSIGGLDERLWLLVMIDDEAVGGGLTDANVNATVPSVPLIHEAQFGIRISILDDNGANVLLGFP